MNLNDWHGNISKQRVMELYALELSKKQAEIDKLKATLDGHCGGPDDARAAAVIASERDRALVQKWRDENLVYVSPKEIKLLKAVAEAASNAVGTNSDGTAGYQPECDGSAQDLWDALHELEEMRTGRL